MEAPTGPKVSGMAPRSIFVPQETLARLSLESVVTGPASSDIPAAVQARIRLRRAVAHFAVIMGPDLRSSG
jgi:hypothetical protein